MSCPFCIKRNPNRCITLASWLFFLVCLAALFAFSYECLDKFLDFPQAVDISTHSQNKYEFPAITLCPYYPESDLSNNPLSWNISNIEKCGLEYDDIFDRKIVIGSNGSCADPRSFWDDISLWLEAFGIKSIEIGDFHNNNIRVNTTNERLIWKRILSEDRGTCFTLTFTKDVLQKGIRFILMEIKVEKKFYIFIHQHSLLNTQFPWTTLDMALVNIFPNDGFAVDIRYDKIEKLDFDGNVCEMNLNYSYSECLNEQIEKESLKKVGCTSQYVQNQSKICVNAEKLRKAIEVSKGVLQNNSCLYPCHYLGNFETSTRTSWPGYHYFNFKRYVQVYESRYAYELEDFFAARWIFRFNSWRFFVPHQRWICLSYQKNHQQKQLKSQL